MIFSYIASYYYDEVVVIKNQLFRRKTSFKMPVRAVGFLAACAVLFSGYVRFTVPDEIAYISALLVMPESAAYKVNETKKNIIAYIQGERNIDFFQKSGTLNENENYTDLTSTPSDIFEIMENYDPSEYDEDGKTVEKTFVDYQSTDSFENVYVRNVTDTKEIDIQAVLSDDFALPVSDFSQPTVLIYHTHSTETYILTDNGRFSTEYPARSEDMNMNMIRIGDEITKILEANGIGVIHDRTVYDTVYTGAYAQSRKGVEKILEENPSVIITLDIHRDAIYYDDLTHVKPTVDINGMKAAQMMIIAGAQDGNVTDFPDWETNLSFALHLQKTANDKYENLMKPVFFCMRKYNMDMTPYSLLVEVGTDANSLQEAAYSGRLLGDVLSEFIKEYSEESEK